jgi:cysteine desulfurase
MNQTISKFLISNTRYSILFGACDLSIGTYAIAMWFKKRRIYLDYASATPILPEVLLAMHNAEAIFGNPGSLHREAVEAKRILETARKGIARELGCKARQIIFTSGLTESNNLAILGYARKISLTGNLTGTHWITSSIEHSSVLECFGEVERLGGEVTFVDPDPRGIISADALKKVLKKHTVFVSVGWGNNEIGIVQKISDLCRLIHDSNPDIVFHSDAGQAPLYLPPQVHTLDVDMLALGSGKLYGPRAIGALFVREPEKLAPIILGGGQEKGLRSGTEKVASAVGFAKALDGISQERKVEAVRLQKLRDDFAGEIVAQFPAVVINTDLRHSLPHMLNISVPGEKSGEYLALQLDHEGIAVSTKSACDEGSTESHVVSALGGESWRATNTLRFSLGRDTTSRDLKCVLTFLAHLMARTSR